MKIRKKEQKRLIITYQITMALLAIVSILLIVMDLSRAITITAYPYSLVDNLIWGIFTLDYLIRLGRAKNKKDFFVHNIFDLLSIIPVNLAFSIFRINRLGRLFVVIRLLRLTRLVGLIGRLRYFLKFNGLIYYLYISISVLAITSIMFSIAEIVLFGHHYGLQLPLVRLLVMAILLPTLFWGRFPQFLTCWLELV
nr:ion transporter [Limosilactobacillus gastricus]